MCFKGGHKACITTFESNFVCRSTENIRQTKIKAPLQMRCKLSQTYVVFPILNAISKIYRVNGLAILASLNKPVSFLSYDPTADSLCLLIFVTISDTTYSSTVAQRDIQLIFQICDSMVSWYSFGQN